MSDEGRYLKLLRYYGDHRWGCGISEALRGEWPIGRQRQTGEYPPCSCGWDDARKTIPPEEKPETD